MTRKDFLFPSPVSRFYVLPASPSLSLSLSFSRSVSSPFSNVPIESPETNPTSLDPALSANDAEIGVDRNPKQRRATVYARDW